MKTKKILAALGLLAIIGGCAFAIASLSRRDNNGHYSVVASNFAAYDFARAVVGGDNVKMLLKPAAEAHSFEPTPQDIKDIASADFFIYTGGESDEWVAKILQDNNIDEGKTIRMMDFVQLKEEEFSEGMEAESEEEEEGEEEETEYDEHVWTSPLNAIRIVEAIRDRLIAKNPSKLDEYTNNAANYTARLSKIDKKIRKIVKNANRKELIFADRFPFRYFVDEYGLKYYAAFPGCSDQTEASSSTIAFLIEKVKANHTPVILKIELTSDKLAQTIAAETGAKIQTLNAAHNISQADFDAGKTYADIMDENASVLEEALK